jgi:hypothetical protein
MYKFLALKFTFPLISQNGGMTIIAVLIYIANA